MNMSQAASIESLGRALREALVLEAEQDGRVGLRLVVAGGAGREVRARVAAPGYAATQGDRVLVADTDAGELFVIGVVVSAVGPRLAGAGGASAAVEGK